MRFTSVKKMPKNKNLKNLSPEMANILSNFEGWALPKLLIKKKFLIIFACELRVRSTGTRFAILNILIDKQSSKLIKNHFLRTKEVKTSLLEPIKFG